MAKKKLEAKYSVVLREDIPAGEAEFLVALSSGIKLSSGRKLRQFSCTAVRVTAHYLEMDVFKDGASWHLPVKIPHAYVLQISGKEDDARAAGFVLPEKE